MRVPSQDSNQHIFHYLILLLCINQVAFNPNSGQVEHWWRCLPNSQVSLCNVSSALHTTLCCNSGDNCNENLNPVLGTTSGTVHRPTLTPSGPSTAPLMPILRPENPETTTSENPEIPTSENPESPTSGPPVIVSTPEPPETVDTTIGVEVTTTMDGNIETSKYSHV